MHKLLMQLEDTNMISYKKRVLFVSASKITDQLEPFRLERVAPKMDHSFASHAIAIPAIAHTCLQCFEKVPEVKLPAIKG